MSEQNAKNVEQQFFFKERSETNLVVQLIHRYLPFWPLFAITVSLSLAVAIVYLRAQPRIYSATGRVLLKDPNKNGSDSKVLDALNIFGEKKIVDNEIVVMRSSSVMQEVVKRLDLYAPIYNQGRIRVEELYGANAPVHFIALNKDSINWGGQHFFHVDWARQSVMIDGTAYPFNGIVTMGGTPYRVVPTPGYNQNAAESKNLYVVFNTPAGVAGGLSGSTSAAPLSPQSTVIDFSMTTEIPEKGVNVINTLFSVYNEFAITDKNQTAAKTLAFIEDRLHLVISQLDSVEKGVRDYKVSNNIYDLSGQASNYFGTVKDLDKQKSEIDLQLEVLSSVEDYINRRNLKAGTLPSMVLVGDGALSGLLNNLYSAETALDNARSTGGEKSEPVIAAEEAIVRLKETIRDNIKTIRSNLLVARGNINRRINESSGLLQTVPDKEIGLVNISRQQAIKNNIYTFLLQKREETALNSAATIADLRVIESAWPGGLISPVPKNYYITGLLVGMLLAAGFIMAREQLNRKILFRQELEAKVSVPVIAELLQLHRNEHVVIKEGKRTAIAEQFRALRTNLSFMGLSNGHNCVLLTSSVSGEGKSFTAVNLAISLTLTGKKVALVEGDLRKPKLSKLLGIERTPGISNFIISDTEFDDIVRPTEYSGLFLIPAGTIPPNPSELILRPRFALLMKTLKENFDFVIIDTAPVGPVTDAFLLKDFADATIYMVRHDVTPKVYMKLIDDLHTQHKFNNMAIVYNGLKRRGFAYYGSGVGGGGYDNYGYGYGYTYGYGNSYYTEDGKKNGAVRKLTKRFVRTFRSIKLW